MTLLTLDTRYAPSRAPGKLLALEEALATQYPSDAHFQPCCSTSTGFRLSGRVIKSGEVTDAEIHHVFLDIDFHELEGDELEDAKHKTISMLEIARHDGWGYYETTGGLRAFRSLENPYPINPSTKKQWIAEYVKICHDFTRLYDINCDLTCAEPMRLFRAPFVIRHGKPYRGRFAPSHYDHKTLVLDQPEVDRVEYRQVGDPSTILAQQKMVTTAREKELWKMLGNHSDYQVRQYTQRAKAGQPIALTHRDTSMFRFCNTLAYLDECQSTAEGLTEMLSPCTAQWAILAETSYEEKRAEVLDKITRAQRDFAEQKAGKIEQKEEAQQAVSQAVVGDAAHKAAPLLAFGRYYLPFMFSHSKYYHRFLLSTELYAVFRIAWPEGSPVTYKTPTKNGERLNTLIEIVEENGVNIDRLIYDFNVLQVTLEEVQSETGGLHALMPCAPRRQLTPVYDPIVDQFLKKFTDDPRLQQWLAFATRQDLPCAALYLLGAKNVGKSLIGQSLSRLWVNDAAMLGTALSRFSFSVTRSPLWWLDEGLIESSNTHVGNKVRQIIGAKQHEVEEKHQPKAVLRGCPRILITANNLDALQSQTNSRLGQTDREAVAERIILIEANPEAMPWLEREIGTENIDRHFVQENRLASHALWLETQHDPPTQRFCVAGDPSDLYAMDLLSHREDSDLVLEWLIEFLETAEENRKTVRDYYCFKAAGLCLKTKAIQRTFKRFHVGDDNRCPHHKTLKGVLTRLGGPAKTVRHPETRATSRFHVIPRLALERMLKGAQRDDIDEVLALFDVNMENVK